MSKILSFFTEDYLFNLRPDPMTKSVTVLAIIFSLFLIAGIILYILTKKEKLNPLFNLKSRLTNIFLTAGIVGLFLTFFRWQGIPYLSSRFLLFILFIAVFIWFLFSIPFFKKVPQQLKSIKEKENFEKYLPKKKNKIA